MHYASLVTLPLLAACTPSPQPYSAEFLALGTTTSITVIDSSSNRAQAATREAETAIKRLGVEWYPWRSDGELVRVNDALAKGQNLAISSELRDILQRSREFFQLSAGAFDPSLGLLVKLWGFDQAERSGDQSLPTESQLQAWRANHPTFTDIVLGNGNISSLRRDVVIDLGAIGKGYAVDRAIELLRRQGITRALVNAGGNLRAIGQNVEGPWQIAIHNPRGHGALYSVALHADESVSTSGDDQRFMIEGEHRWHHLLDPRSGLPAEHTIAVTVFAADATTADAASTAIFVAGPQDWRTVAQKLGVRSVLRIDASGRVQVTRELMPRLIAAKTPRTTTGDQPAKRDMRSTAVEIVDL